jgi:hypothetical protein
MTAAYSADADSPAAVGSLFWPFLISRGHRMGYRVVAAPDFLVAGRLSGLLFDLAGGAPSGPDRARYRLALGTPVGDLVVMFTVRLADASDLGHAAPGAPSPLDEHSRRIPLIEGVVERGGRFVPGVGDGPLRAGREACGPLFSRFWEAGEGWSGTAATAAFRMDRRAGHAVGWERMETFRLDGSVHAGGVSAFADAARSAGKGETPKPRRGPLGGLGKLLRRLLAWAVGDRRS